MTLGALNRTVVNGHHMTAWSDDHVPYICWDRNWTVGDIRGRLAGLGWPEKADLAAWIMREAKFQDVWVFLTPEEVGSHISLLLPKLGRRRELWEYIVRTWYDLGKLKSSNAA